MAKIGELIIALPACESYLFWVVILLALLMSYESKKMGMKVFYVFLFKLNILCWFPQSIIHNNHHFVEVHLLDFTFK